MARSNPVLSAVGLLVATVGSLGWGCYTAWRQWEIAAWPVVEGKVTRSDVESYRSQSRRRTVTKWRLAVAYEYVAEGQVRTGTHVAPTSHSFDSETSARAALAAYAEGAPVKAFVNPADASEAYLETYSTFDLGVPFGLAALFGAFTVVSGFQLLRG